jgi:hypothetical protein
LTSTREAEVAVSVVGPRRDDDVALLALFDAGGEVCVRGAGLVESTLVAMGWRRWEAVDEGDVEVTEEGEGE